nr:MAG TPA: hypothetical protein [Caudoviricetes sp.]
MKDQIIQAIKNATLEAPIWDDDGRISVDYVQTYVTTGKVTRKAIEEAAPRFTRDVLAQHLASLSPRTVEAPESPEEMPDTDIDDHSVNVQAYLRQRIKSSEDEAKYIAELAEKGIDINRIARIVAGIIGRAQ